MENSRYQRLAQFGDDLPKEWYAFTRDGFYIYRNYSFMDYEILNEIANTDGNAKLISEIKGKIESGTYNGAKAFNSWAKDFRSGRRRNSWHFADAEETTSTGRDDGVDVRERGSDNATDSSQDGGDREKVKPKFSLETVSSKKKG